MKKTIILGNNRIVDCSTALLINDVEVFRLRERTGDDQLVADFEVRDKDDNLLAKIAKNNVVFSASGYKVRNGPDYSEVFDSISGKVLARAEEISPGTIRVTGIFHVNGYRVSITENSLQLGGITLSGNEIIGFGKAIAIKEGSTSIGIQR